MVAATTTSAKNTAVPGTRHPSVRPRPPVFRALGASDPPAAVEIDGEVFQCSEILKHDSWAATGIYASATRQAVCKFNRRQPILRLPMAWLGRRLAAREQGFMDRLAGIDGVPGSLGPVCVAGKRLDNAVSRQFITGHALRPDERVNAEFFPRFDRLLAEVHRRGVAHVDLHKRENILVDEAGRPHLIDFQISFALPASNGLAARCLRGVLGVLQRCDAYHLLKHRMKHAPEASRPTARDIERMRPWWIRLHRSVAVPFRTVRRGFLVWLGIRNRSGQAGSEWFPEVAHR